MSLREYHRKRDFTKTAEPRADAKVPKGSRRLFVVQLHHASHRHFDFRLQVGDTLKSWAVPKGPSFDPKVKRLAVQVEDHPVSYADFEGDIAHGYGKGHVDQFDKGVWSTAEDAQEQLKKGHLTFQLHGKRLRGSWHLIRSHKKERQPSWFLIKGHDAFAGETEADDLLDAKMRRSTQAAAGKSAEKQSVKQVAPKKRSQTRFGNTPLRKAKTAGSARIGQITQMAAAMAGAKRRGIAPGFFKPELSKLREQAPQGDTWLHEVKWDGYRILASIDQGEVTLWSRNGLPWNEKIPEIVAAVSALGLDSARLDGELIAVDARGLSDFNALQRTLSGEAHVSLSYVLFDLPYIEGVDLSQCALLDRKAILEKLLKGRSAPLQYSSHSLGNGAQAFALAEKQHIEGIVSKRVNSVYHAGRGDDWLKIKQSDSDEFAVVGYTKPKGSRKAFGSLLLARPDPRRKSGWIYAGRVGSGFDNRELERLGATLARGGTSKPRVSVTGIDPQLRDARWVAPTAVAEVYFRGTGNKDLLRQPSLKTLREDKSPDDLRDADRAVPGLTAVKSALRSSATTRRGHSGHKRDTNPDAITITHPDRVVFPGDGITKQDVVDYYKAVMPWFLPGVIDRPVSVVRCPNGAGKDCFFQKHLMAGLHHVGTVKLKEEDGAAASYLYPTSATSIIELAQFGAIEFHPWGATIQQSDRADRIVFDLDPGPDVTWHRVKAAARRVREFLTHAGLQSFVRTTGGKGLHVVVPLTPGCTWKIVKGFAHAFANALSDAYPQEFIATASKAKRNGRIYVDYLRNGRGATSVASYSLRARQRAPVAVPIAWSELSRLKSGDQFTLKDVIRRLNRLKTDPWDGFDGFQQNLDEVLQQLTDELS